MTFEECRARVGAANAAMAAAEQECLAAVMALVRQVCEAEHLRDGKVMVFHARPRDPGVIDLDLADCSADDAVLEAVDLADARGRRLRRTRSGLAVLPPGPVPPPPIGEEADRPLGDQAWREATLAWVEMHQALNAWTRVRAGACLVIAPDSGDVAGLHPLYCPDEGRDFHVVTSLRLCPDEAVPADDLEAALQAVLADGRVVDPDVVEQDLRDRLERAGLQLPGVPAHREGECGLVGPCPADLDF